MSAPPAQGRANDAVLGLLADVLGVRRAQLRLVGGAAGKDKVVEIAGLTSAEADRRLAAAGPRA